MESEIKKRLELAIKDKVFPGAVVGAFLGDGMEFIIPVGNFTYEKDSPKVKIDTIYDLASVTKMITTSSVLLKLLDLGDIELETKISDFLSDFGNLPNKDQVNVKHLLTYTLDLDIPSTASLINKEADEIMSILVKAPLKSKPGSMHIYTNSTAVISGLFIEKVTKKNLKELSKDFFYRPLEMSHTYFDIPEDLKNQIPPTEIDNYWRNRIIQGEVHDESTSFLQSKGYYLGAAGLFSNVPDLLVFMRMLLNEGTYNGRQFFSKDLVKEMHTNQLGSIGEERGLGWDMNSKYKMGDLSSSNVFGHTGFTGSMVLCDPVQKVVIVMLSNRTFPKRPADGKAINEVRHDIADIVFKYKKDGSREN